MSDITEDLEKQAKAIDDLNVKVVKETGQSEHGDKLKRAAGELREVAGDIEKANESMAGHMPGPYWMYFPGTW